MTRDFHYEVSQVPKDGKSFKNKFIKFIQIASSLKLEKIIFSFNAIFEGIGIAGIISAAFWYATAPMAPNGFNGPIATFTIAFSTIASLLIAIPIAYNAYKKLIMNIDKYYAEYQTESKGFDNSVEELYFELLKLRALFENDDEFLHNIKDLRHDQLVWQIALSVCQIYSIYSDKFYSIKWDSSLNLMLSEEKNVIHSMKFRELLKLDSLINIKAFRKAIVKCLFQFHAKNEPQYHSQKIHIKKDPATRGYACGASFKSMCYAVATGITCTEVLLSIGWTVASILIGIKVILPVSTEIWIAFALSCVGLGPIFGIGIYVNQLKQINRDALTNELRTQNQRINDARGKIDLLFAKKILEQKNMIDLNQNLKSKKAKLKCMSF